MDSKTRNLAIVLVISVFALVIGMVFYVNNKETVATNKDQTNYEMNQNIVGEGGYGENLTEEQLHAFLKDETFFDPDTPISKYTVSENSRPKLYLLATSLEKDIRVAVVDDKGDTVTGYPFYVTIDESQYKDLDQDGIIYVPDLKPGDYFVSLEAVKGYDVPADPMHVYVKEQLEFKVMDDISYLIMTEDQIDVALEDTEIQEAELEAEDTENTGLIQNVGKSFGIDVSKWQKDINWEKVANSGVKFAIIRCGYRGSSTGCLVEDPYFVKNIEGAKAAGIKVGVYFFTQATNTVEAVEEASMVATLCKNYELDYPVFIDTEGAGGRGRADGLDVQTRTDVCDAFCQTVEASGYTAGIYASRSWFYNNLEDARLQNYVLWDAEYRKEPIYKGDFKLWQYTSNGYIDGINTRVDLNISYVDFSRNEE